MSTNFCPSMVDFHAHACNVQHTCCPFHVQMLVPLPETIMSCQPVLPLNDVAGGKQASQRPTQKKDRRKLRHQQWIQSVYIVVRTNPLVISAAQ